MFYKKPNKLTTEPLFFRIKRAILSFRHKSFDERGTARSAALFADKPFFFLGLGMLSGCFAMAGYPIPSAVLIILCFVAVIVIATSKRLALLFVFAAAFSIGALRYKNASVIDPSDISHFAGFGFAQVEGTIDSGPTAKANHVTLYLHCNSVHISNRLHYSAKGSLLVNIFGDSAGLSQELDEGDRIVVSGKLSGVDDRGASGASNWLRGRGVYCMMSARGGEAVKRLASSQGAGFFQSVAATLRRGLLRSLENSMPTPQLGLLVGILLGIRTSIDPSLLLAFSATGAYHLLATAGLHMAIVYKLLRRLYESILLPSKISAIFCIVSLWIYDYMAGNRMAVTRAAVMATIYLAGVILERAPNVLNSLGATACILLFLNPMQALDAGFVISFAAVLMIGLCMPVWDILLRRAEEKIENRNGKMIAANLKDLVGATLFAQAGAAPACAYFFNIVSFLGAFANLLLVPTLFLIIPIGFFVAFSGLLFPLGAKIIAHAALAPLVLFDEKIVVFFSKIPGAWTNAPSPSPFALTAYYMISLIIMLGAWRYAALKIRTGELDSEEGR